MTAFGLGPAGPGVIPGVSMGKAKAPVPGFDSLTLDGAESDSEEFAIDEASVFKKGGVADLMKGTADFSIEEASFKTSGTDFSIDEGTAVPAGNQKMTAFGLGDLFSPPDTVKSKPAAPPPIPGGPPRTTMMGIGQRPEGTTPKAPAFSGFEVHDQDTNMLSGKQAAADLDDTTGLQLGLLPDPESANRMPTSDFFAAAAEAQDSGLDDGIDLPAPKKAGDISIGALDDDGSSVDLPAPVSGKKTLSGPAFGNARQIPNAPNPRATDLSAPFDAEGATDLPAPRGFFDDGAAPSGGSSGFADLPAPKSFFDDALQPKAAGPAAPAASGFSDLPAPKGFFDDALQPKAPAAKGAGRSDLPAPKGFFDDSLQPKQAGGGPPTAAPQASGFHHLPAPKGFFDDVDAPPPSGAPSSSPLDLDGLDLSSPARKPDAPGASRPFGLDSLDKLNMEPPRRAPAPPPTPDAPFSLPPGRFEGLDLPPEGRPQTAEAAAAGLSFSSSSTALLDEEQLQPGTSNLEIDTDDKPGVEAPKAKAKKPEKKKKVKGPLLSKNVMIIGAAFLGLVFVGAGGLWFWQKKSKEDAIVTQLKNQKEDARKQLRDVAPNHWERAASIANGILKTAPSDADALGIVAEAHYAALLDEGTNAKARKSAGSDAIAKARSAGLRSPHLEKAFALQSIVERRSPEALKRLEDLLATQPQDGDAQLYLGWAHADKHDYGKAAQAFSKALEKNPLRIPALYGLARAQVSLGKYKEARENYHKASNHSQEKFKKAHIGALVGLGRLAEIDRFGDRENRYLEILERDDLDRADPRAVSEAWALAGDEALKAGRVEEAERRYGKALDLDPENLAAFTGQGKVAVRQNNLELARDRLQRVLGLDPENVDARLTMAEAKVLGQEYQAASELAQAVIDLKLQDADANVRAHMVRAAVLEADAEQTAAAEAAYRDAAAAAPEGEIAPLIALSRLYVKLGRGQDAIAVLKPLRAQASTDAAAAVALGVALLDSGDPKSAEEALKQALTQRPGDVEATFQLGRAVRAQGRNEEAIERLSQAYQANETREDIGLQLASLYEELRRVEDAAGMYERLLAARAPSINARSRAGRFFARQHQYERAASLGEMILQEQPRNPAGLFLSGEAMFAQGMHREARERFQDAVRLDPQPQYLNSLAYASERLALYEDAVTFYSRSAENDPKYATPRIGLARVHLARGDFKLALEPLLQAREIEPNDPEIHFLLGRAYRSLIQNDLAITSFSTAINLKPTLAEAHYHRGLALLDVDRAKEATTSFDAAVTHAQGDEKWLDDAYYQLGYSARIASDCPTALKAWEQYLLRTTGEDPLRRAVQSGVLRLKASCK